MKKFLSLILILLLISTNCFATEDNSNTTYAEKLQSIGVFKGDSVKGFELDRAPTRLEGLVMFVRLLGAESTALNSNFAHPFDDVPNWATKYVGWAYANGYTKGVSVTKFGNGNMDAASYFTLMLRALDYDDTKGDFTWSSAIEYASKIGIISESDTIDYKAESFIRGDLAKVTYNTLNCNKKYGSILAQQLVTEGVFKSTEVNSIGLFVEDNFPGYSIITVDGGNLSGTRQANVAVDIGYGDREYWAFTNVYGQLVKVTAERITPQDPAKEKVNSDGRYYPDEAKVPGTERSDLDEGHVIADSLGGVANAYNITPQDSTLNRYGDQAYMEKVIRDAGGCIDFEAIITYPNTTTQIPSHYAYSYTLLDKDKTKVTDSFDNVNPDVVNKPIIEEQNKQPVPVVTPKPVVVVPTPVTPTNNPKKKITMDYTILSNNSVGNEWGTYMVYKDKSYFDSNFDVVFDLTKDAVIQIGAYESDDAKSDFGSKTITITKKELQTGVIKVVKVTVEENGGRYSGNTATVEVSISIQP